jgi:hypothetical protein
MLLVLYFMVPLIVLFSASKLVRPLSFRGLLVSCLLSVALGQAILYLTLSSGIPALTFGYEEVDASNAVDMVQRDTSALWMLRWVSERYGWVFSIVWFWLGWAVWRLAARKHNKRLQPIAREDARSG